MRKLRIYLDTSVINFVFADDAPEKRDATRDFFTRYVATKHYDVAVSAVVLAEIGRTARTAKGCLGLLLSMESRNWLSTRWTR